ncbi:hypothetical protein TSAR_009782 [Trichomalopsis sarcophagae]|uniref:Uncharacterized protein n=1 Tax=Trichomalopsis sarcophagae TaxID=543379 RepID=A0A232EJW6_9HYME|nr:hypothetical protein TSAR_009782 [Trichomalopsis sarcophagae]
MHRSTTWRTLIANSSPSLRCRRAVTVWERGPQLSSSSDRSFLLNGNLAAEEYRVTRRRDRQFHMCAKDKDIFCYVYGDFEVRKLRRQKSDESINI